MIVKKEIEFPLYRGLLIIMITDEENTKIEDYYDTLGDEIIIEYAHCVQVNGIRNGNKIGSYLAAFNIDNRNRKITNGVLSHEAFHVVDGLFADRGIRLSDESSEAYSYLIEWVIDQIYKVFIENKISVNLNE